MQVVGQIPFKVLQELTDAAPGDYYAHRDIKTLLGKLYEVAVTSEALDMAQDKTALIELPPVPGSGALGRQAAHDRPQLPPHVGNSHGSRRGAAAAAKADPWSRGQGYHAALQPPPAF